MCHNLTHITIYLKIPIDMNTYNSKSRLLSQNLPLKIPGEASMRICFRDSIFREFKMGEKYALGNFACHTNAYILLRDFLYDYFIRERA